MLKPLCIKGHYQQSEQKIHGTGKIFSNYKSDKRSISRLYTELLYVCILLLSHV